MELGFWIAPVAAVVIVGLVAVFAAYTRPKLRMVLVRRPDRCPFCHSKAVDTLAKQITAATSWRCKQCGEVWNVARLQRSTRL
jgi:ribosomal protein L37AE/L43A